MGQWGGLFRAVIGGEPGRAVIIICHLSLVIEGTFLGRSFVICHWSLVEKVSEVSKVSKVSEGGKEGSREDRKLGSWEEGKGRRQETEGGKDGGSNC